MPREAGAPVLRAGGSVRVLMVLESNFTPRGGGGAESQLRTLALHLRKLGHEVTVVTPRSANGPQATAERCFGIPVGRLAYPRVRFVGGAVMCLRLALLLWRKRRRYDAWHVHIAHHLGAITCLMGALLGKPVIVKIAGWWEFEQGLLAPGRGLGAVVARMCLRHARVVQAISTRVAAELRERGFREDRILVVPNAVDVSRFRLRPAPRQARTRFTAVSVGRLVREKGLGMLLDAWADVFGRDSDARLLLVGEGVLEKALHEQAGQLGISHQVEFLGHRDRVEDVLAEADVGVLPSLFEGLSNTLLEFMACGLPVIATRVSGSEDLVVTGRNGWLCAVSREALGACLREAAMQPRERLHELGRRARLDVESSASLVSVVNRLLAVYRGSRPSEAQGGAG